MKYLKKAISIVLVFMVFHLFFSSSAFCQSNWYAKADITKNAPVIKSLPEEKIPVETVKGKGGGSKWIWALLGVAVVGGAVAAAGGGGGGGDGDDDDNEPTTPTTGNVTVTW